MPRYLALLRGISVGGRNRAAMADLRRVVASLRLAVPNTRPSQPGLVSSSFRMAVLGEMNASERVLASASQFARI